MIISFYDSDYDEKLSYLEFLNLNLTDSNLTITKNTRRINNNNNNINNSIRHIPDEIDYALSILLEKDSIISEIPLG